MKRAVIIAPDGAGMSKSIENAFKKLNWSVESHVYWPLYGKSILRKVCDRLFVSQQANLVKNDFNKVFRERVLSSIKFSKTDLLLVLKGNCLDEENSEVLCKAKVPVVLWCIDTIGRAPEQMHLADKAIHIFYIDGGDVGHNKEKSSWLPLGFDDDLIRPEQLSSFPLDLLLIGNLGSLYSRRRMFLRRVSDSSLARKYRCGFIGSTGTITGNFALFSHYGGFRNRSVEWISRNIQADDLPKVISSSRICLNIHQDDGESPVNPLFFVIPATGSCQFAEKKEYLSKWLTPGKDYVEFADDEFLSKLQVLLEDNDHRNFISKNGIVSSSSHTYTNRVKTILSKLGIR